MKILKEKDKNKIIDFLNEIDNDFDIKISDRVNIIEYTNKILKNGHIIAEMDNNNNIVGIIVMYANDVIKREGYISLLGVSSKNRNQHIATKLLKESLKKAEECGMETMKLYTHKNNLKAKAMYEKNGFKNVASDRQHSDCYTKKLNRKKILVTAIGSFSADIVIKSLHNMEYDVVGTDIYDSNWIVESKEVEFFEKAPLVKEKEKYISFIKNICSKYDINYIFPLTDPEVDTLSKYKKEFGENNIIICTSDEDVIEKCRNKYELPKILSKIDNINIIETKKLEEIDENNIKYPSIIKPINGRSSQECYKIFNQNEFKYYREICSNKNNMIIQPMIEGNIVTVDVVSDVEHNVSVSIPRRELLRTGNGAGTTVETFFDESLVDICDRIVKYLSIKGAVNIEFIEKAKGEYYFLEINPRFSGGLEFSHLEGYNVVKNHLRCFNNEKIDNDIEYKEMIIARKYEEYIMKKENYNG